MRGDRRGGGLRGGSARSARGNWSGRWTGRRRSAAAAAAASGGRRPARRLSEVRDREIAHELRWNRCAELAVSLELTVIEAALLTVVSMFCVTAAFVCWETRAGLMGMARIKTNASFAAAVATLMRHGLLVPVDGAPRTAWYLGESFWAGCWPERNSTPRWRSWCAAGAGRRTSGRAAPRRTARPVADGGNDSGVVGAEVEDRPSTASGAAPSPGKPGPEEPEAGSGSVENRTSDAERRDAADGGEAQTGQSGREPRGKADKGAVPERPAAADGKERVTVARFVAEELADDPHRAKIAERLADFSASSGRGGSRGRGSGVSRPWCAAI